ncbi:tRNA epoxyqueuosine(34) reductase QueG [Cyclobacterium jeungdonense]|uniref:Epoxyqueuosine reductase n=1 Tax=Cyclobacterium jeungdonense TaxID=708087 RepID=A0ABT8C895_9BACT|nr:tRNA epoxyqueuosine(34) reductase QueG [Cyclobacterium jeungdonense]MDN3687886.1 tRNA epoxyqueuosine(34) reductase QueG [Cyclobacterium jeungdonense]
MDTRKKNSQFIKETAQMLGFDFCGIAKSAFLEEEAPKLESWLDNNYQGKMAYMANHFDKRLDPGKLVDNAQSVISLIYNYYPPKKLPEGKQNIKIAKYAYGKDYHFVIKDKLKRFLQILQEEIGEINGRAFVDSAPVMERQWAQKAGLGWTGKNSLLLNQHMGSFFFLAELIIDLPLHYDAPIAKDYCGNCTRCLDACPTDAILQANLVDASKCISYLTIELKEEIPEEFKGKMENWAFGCDICQDVCPWNRFSRPHQEPEFLPPTELESLDWEEMTKETFDRVFKKSALKRSKWEGLRRNIKFIRVNQS